ncbi:MAG: hypothetical protein EPO40_24265 [Myxococcaceae bacterium]|nr:MAG: hypothetical protein EPO40_24265 [Myxococcaceae bacterium]
MTLPWRLDEASARHELPHPIAVLCDRLRTHDDASRLSAVLVLAEGVARYLALILLADAAARATSPTILSRYATARGFGSALGTIQHFANASRGAPDRLLPELDALIGSPWWLALDRFKSLRNDISHARVNLSAEAATLLRRHDDDLRTLIDGCAFLVRYPLGILRAVRTGGDGRASGRWQACRGPTPRGGLVDLHDAGGIPSDQLLLVDTARARVLTVAPFLCLLDDDFYWLDLPSSEDRTRTPYRSPVPGVPARDSLPTGLYDPRGANPDGLPLAQWLGDRDAWPRYTDLSLRPSVIAQVIASSQATRLDVGASSPAPVASIHPVSAPPPVAAPRSARRPLALGLVVTAALVFGGALAFTAVRSRSTPAVEPLSPRLDAWLQNWYGHVLAQQSEHAPFLNSFYAPSVRFVGSRETLRNADWISNYWHTLLVPVGSSFVVDWSESRWRHEALDPDMPGQVACRMVPGASGDVLLVRLRATGIEPHRATRTPDLPCDRLDGFYLLRLREVTGRGLVICHESWAIADGICAAGSCPQAPICRSR